MKDISGQDSREEINAISTYLLGFGVCHSNNIIISNCILNTELCLEDNRHAHPLQETFDEVIF